MKKLPLAFAAAALLAALPASAAEEAGPEFGNAGIINFAAEHMIRALTDDETGSARSK